MHDPLQIARLHLTVVDAFGDVCLHTAGAYCIAADSNFRVRPRGISRKAKYTMLGDRVGGARRCATQTGGRRDVYD